MTFPALTGRIVDQAGVIPADKQAAITPKLVDLERKSGIQLVIATVRSLEGQAIEPYANELFRTWKLGDAQKNNGVLLLVAPNERKVRIEVGYGLEGTLTDALSKLVIVNSITPSFKAGDFGTGIEKGVNDIIEILTTDAASWQAKHQDTGSDGGVLPNLLFVLLILFFVWMFVRFARSRRGFQASNNGVWISTSSGNESSSRSSSSSDSFSGDGGSSGGGGASGDW